MDALTRRGLVNAVLSSSDNEHTDSNPFDEP
jgi:hypothetical protein